jgi:hypothetical protein
VQENIPSFAERDDYDKVNKNQDFPKGEPGMKALNYQEPQKARHNGDISSQVGSQQRLCPFEKS